MPYSGDSLYLKTSLIRHLFLQVKSCNLSCSYAQIGALLGATAIVIKTLFGKLDLYLVQI